MAAAYRTASLMALQVITGITPIDLMVLERTYIYVRRQEECNTVAYLAKANSIRTWQNRCERERDKVQWTKRLIRNINGWVSCKHRELDYFLTQALTGHGCFRSYAKKFGKDSSDECIYCGAIDTVEHTLFQCDRWHQRRNAANTKLGQAITPDTMVPLVIETTEGWEVINNIIRSILKTKEHEELDRQRITASARV